MLRGWPVNSTCALETTTTDRTYRRHNRAGFAQHVPVVKVGALEFEQLVDEDLRCLEGAVLHWRGLLIGLLHVERALLVLDDVPDEAIGYLRALLLLRVHLGHFVDKVQLVPGLENAVCHDLE